MPRVLVVDDDAGIRNLLSRILGMEGFIVASAANGSEALQYLATSPADLIILDLRMPVMDGWQFYERLRDGEMRDIPVIVITAGETLSRARQDFPGVPVLTKPFDFDEIIAVIKERVAERQER